MITSQGYAIVVDDHPVVARGIQEFLRANRKLSAVHIAASVSDCLALIELHGSPAIVIIDFWLPSQSSTTLIERLVQLHTITHILVISGDDDPAVQAKAREAGAHGFLLKHETPDMFSAAVTGVLAGVPWFYVTGQPKGERTYQHELAVSSKELGLSARQAQILMLLLHGHPNKRIARELVLAESTVKEHVTGILQKLQVQSRVQVITKLRGRRLVID